MAKQDRTKSKRSASQEAKTPPRLFHWKKPEKRKFRYVRAFNRAELLPAGAALVLFLAACLAPVGPLLKLIAFAVTALVAGFSVLRRCFLRAVHLKAPDEDALLIPASVLCFLAGRPAVGALLVLLGRTAQLTQAYVQLRSQRAVQALGDVLPEKAHAEESFGRVDVLPEELKVGDVFCVEKGEAVPVDGVVLSGVGPVDSSRFGGPETPVAVQEGDEVLSGTVNTGETLRLRAVRSFENSGLSRHLQSLNNAGRKKTRFEGELERVCSITTLCMIGLAAVVGLIVPLMRGEWSKWLLRAAMLLFLTTPSALILSVPATFLGGMSCASHSGMRVKSKRVLDKLWHVRTVVFGKTGTVTDGHYSVTEVVPVRGTNEELLRLAAAAESVSRHPIAAAIREAAGRDPDGAEVLNAQELPGRGVSALIDGKQVYAGNATLLGEHAVWFRVPDRPGAAVHIAVDGIYQGYILLSDKIREGAFDTVEELRSLGVRNVVMLTGDVRSVTAKLARALNFDMVKSDLSAEEKISSVDYLRRSLGVRETLACVGDGFHDAAMFKKADVGIALSAMGDDSAEKAADVILMDSDLARIPEVVRIARGTGFLVRESAYGLAAVKLLLTVLAVFGAVSPVPALIMGTAADMAVSLNALRGFIIE